MKLTPEQKLKWLILTECDDIEQDDTISLDEWIESEFNYSEHYDSVMTVRRSGIPTNISTPWSGLSHHYESTSVAVQCPDNSWVGFTYWSGGGKHGDPDSIDWMNHAYDLDCVEEEKLMIVRTFKKQDEK